jgi:hypothetical protein
MAAEASWEAFPMPLGSTVALFIPQAFSTPGGIERDRFCGSISLTTEIGDKFKPVQFGDQASASLTCSNKKIASGMHGRSPGNGLRSERSVGMRC